MSGKAKFFILAIVFAILLIIGVSILKNAASDVYSVNTILNGSDELKSSAKFGFIVISVGMIGFNLALYLGIGHMLEEKFGNPKMVLACSAALAFGCLIPLSAMVREMIDNMLIVSWFDDMLQSWATTISIIGIIGLIGSIIAIVHFKKNPY